MEVTPVYFHDCPALGPHTRVPRAVKMDRDNKVILMYHHVCPLCFAAAGEIEYAKGVTPLADGGYSVDMSIAERVE